MRSFLVAVVVIVAGRVDAQGAADVPPGEPSEGAGRQALVSEAAASARNWANVRVGGSPSALRPQLCVEATPLEMIGVEACGSGSGFLHREAVNEIAHFRGKVRLAAKKTDAFWVEPWVAAGFAELQIGEDTPGFDFAGTGPTGVETAGPDVGASVRVLMPVGAGFEMIGEVGIGAAWFPHAPRLRVPMDAFQPQATLHLGVGF